jgi:beta-lactamase regulating signal transducer with metallopeptidase domain
MNGIEVLSSVPLMRPVAWALTHFLWQGALVGVLLAAALVLLDGKSASLRYAVSVGALALLLALPVATTFWLARAWEKAVAPVERPLSGVASPDDRPASASAEPDLGPPCPEALLWFLAFWTSGVAILSLYNAGGWIQVRRLRSRGIRPVPESWETIVDGLRRRLGIARAVRILETSALAVPAVIGCLRPVILVPASALTGLTPRQLEAILAHELAHVRRHDYLVNLLQTMVETLLFYHPVVWWVSRVIRREREHCCDDLAVALCGDRMVYARALAELEGLRAAPPHLVMASANGPLLARIRRIASLPSESSRSWLAGVLALSLLPVGAALHISSAAGPLREYQALGFGDLPRQELFELARHGVTPEYIREWKRSGYPTRKPTNLDEVRHYAESLRELRDHEITTAEFWAMIDRGYDEPHLLKEQGITLRYVRELETLGYRDLSRDQLIRFRKQGIDNKILQEFAALGYHELSPKDLLALTENEIDAELIQKARAREGRNPSVAELVKLRQETRLHEIIREESWMGGADAKRRL